LELENPARNEEARHRIPLAHDTDEPGIPTCEEFDS
jgi:hypothetical protein